MREWFAVERGSTCLRRVGAWRHRRCGGGRPRPADARLLQAASLRTQEAALTGESTPVEKLSAALPDSDLPCGINETCSSWDHRHGWKGRAVVVAIGSGTELGRIATFR